MRLFILTLIFLTSSFTFALERSEVTYEGQYKAIVGVPFGPPVGVEFRIGSDLEVKLLRGVIGEGFQNSSADEFQVFVERKKDLSRYKFEAERATVTVLYGDNENSVEAVVTLMPLGYGENFRLGRASGFVIWAGQSDAMIDGVVTLSKWNESSGSYELIE